MHPAAGFMLMRVPKVQVFTVRAKLAVGFPNVALGITRKGVGV